MKVEIWSDVVCPWCYIGKRRFEGALARFGHADDVEVVWRSFELDPRAPVTGDLDLIEHLATKYRVSRAEAQAMNDRVTEVGRGDGLEFRLDLARRGNTFDAHRLAHLAADNGRQAEMNERLMAAYFTEGQPIADHGVLRRLAGEAGVDEGRAAEVLAGDAHAEAVRADELDARQLGITSVPFFVLDRRFGVGGAQPADALLDVLDQAWSERVPVPVVGGAGDDLADSCGPDGCDPPGG